MNAKIAILPGDGVGPEIVTETVKVLSVDLERGRIALSMRDVDQPR